MSGGVREIQLTRGLVAIVDETDFERVSSNRWIAVLDNNGAWRAISRASVRGKRRTLQLGRFIMDAPPGLLVDHANGDPLDNRRANLRLCSRSENNRNRRRHGGTCASNPYKGVHRVNRRFLARIGFEGTQIKLGWFGAAEDAARAYDEAAKRLHGEFARLNFPSIALDGV